MTNEEYISLHLNDDVRALALKKVPEGVHASWCLQQIEGRQLAMRKLPQWAATEGIWYPVRLSMEQCSSESTAIYKRDIAQRLTGNSRKNLIDLTGGLGVDFAYMAPLFECATYVEQQKSLCDNAEHNMTLLGINHVNIVNMESSRVIEAFDDSLYYDLIFIDPARRDGAGRKTVAIEDCTPDISKLQEKLLRHARYVCVKLSPMLDITQAIRTLKRVTEVHVVSVQGECKELLIVMSGTYSDHTEGSQPSMHCVNIGSNDKEFNCSLADRQKALKTMECCIPEEGMYIYEPNASIMKGGVQDVMSVRYGLRKVHPMSNLFVGKERITNFPGRCFFIKEIFDFSKESIRRLTNIGQANITTRNFPTTVAELRKRLKIKDGGSTYLFATTTLSNKHIIISTTAPDC